MRYWWNDKEVSVEEYQRLDEEWKKSVEAQELQEKIPPRKKSGIQKIGKKKSY
jgi:hypothetical protein